MRKETVDRINQLEKSIYALRELNTSETLRQSSRNRNTDFIISYTNEICNNLFTELDNDKRTASYKHIDWLGYEYVTN